jgi:hypothetical protein
MNPDQLFSLANLIAMAGWLALIVLPRARWTQPLTTFAIPTVFAIAYIPLVVIGMRTTHGGFSSIVAVRALFDSPWGLLAGWIHYLAFDLFIGAWESRDARRRGIRHPFLIPALILTFLFGPAGLLFYFALRGRAHDAPS